MSTTRSVRPRSMDTLKSASNANVSATARGAASRDAQADAYARDGRALAVHAPQRSRPVNGHAREREQRQRKCDREQVPPRHLLQIVTVIHAVGMDIAGVGTSTLVRGY